MDEYTLDRMVYAYESKIRELRGLDFPSKQDQRQAMLAALQSMWRPAREFQDTGVRVFAFHPKYGAGSAHIGVVSGKWHLHFCLNDEAQPTHFAPPLPGPEE